MVAVVKPHFCSNYENTLNCKSAKMCMCIFNIHEYCQIGHLKECTTQTRRCMLS